LAKTLGGAIRSDIEKLLDAGTSYREIARTLEISTSTVHHHISRIKQNKDAFGPPSGFDVVKITQSYNGDGVLKGQTERSAPETEGAQFVGEFKDGLFDLPVGMFADKATTQYGGDGSLQRQWVKAKIDPLRQKLALESALEAMYEELPRYVPTLGPDHTVSELANLYVFTDCHIGMLAWGKETGDDWDTTIAERTLIRTFEAMIAGSPKAKVAIIGQMGDFLHFDGLLAVTPTSKHVLDADSRFSKIVKVAIRVLRHIINMALLNHEEVYVVMADANHDPASQVWLRHMFTALYENEPRVKVNNSEKPFYAYEHGQTMIGFHHGHTVKKEKLPLLLATLYPKMWGNTVKRYVHTGHLHMVDEVEANGMKIIQHPTIAAKDAYAVRNGWVSQRQASCITYHDVFGEVGRTIVTPEMFEN